MREEPDVEPFSDADRARAVELARPLLDGSGWLNLRPDVDPEALPAQGGSFGLFSVRGPVVPLATLSPSGPVKRGVPRISLGMLHGTGRKVVPMLGEVGVTLDPRWRVLQDNPKRGLVVDVPADEDLEVLVAWLLDLGDGLCPVSFNRWFAEVHHRRR